MGEVKVNPNEKQDKGGDFGHSWLALVMRDHNDDAHDIKHEFLRRCCAAAFVSWLCRPSECSDCDKQLSRARGGQERNATLQKKSQAANE